MRNLANIDTLLIINYKLIRLVHYLFISTSASVLLKIISCLNGRVCHRISSAGCCLLKSSQNLSMILLLNLLFFFFRRANGMSGSSAAPVARRNLSTNVDLACSSLSFRSRIDAEYSSAFMMPCSVMLKGSASNFRSRPPLMYLVSQMIALRRGREDIFESISPEGTARAIAVVP